MSEFTENKCKNCGADLNVNEAKNGVVECAYCHSLWTLPKEGTSPAALQFLRMGEHDLDTCKFGDAFAAYQKALEFDPKEPEAHFGMALAQFKVQYLKDEVNNCLQPICHEISEKVFTEDKNYKNALEFATVEQKKVYRRKGAEIDDIRDEFFALQSSGLSYDCFLCAKVSEGDENLSSGQEIKRETKDSALASEIYYELRDKGYKPFFSQREIKNRTGSAYEALILYALYTSECMLIVCSNEDYLQTKWVKSEYSRFLEMIKGERKERDSLSFVFNGKPIERLPNGKKIQGIDYSKPQAAYLQIFDFVKLHTPEARKKKEEEEKRRKAEEEAHKRAFEEQQQALQKQQEEFAAQQAQLIEEQKRELERLRAQNSGNATNLSGAALLEAIKQAQEEAERKRREEEETARKRRIEEEQKQRLAREIREKEEAEKKQREEAEARRKEKERKAEEERKEREEAHRKYLAQFQIKNSILEKYRGSGGNVVIPDGVTAIGYGAFEGRTGLTEITIPNSVTSIGERAFFLCTSLTKIAIPNSVISIGAWAFEGCTGLSKITLPNSVTEIRSRAFAGCTSLTKITIPNSVTEIEKCAFWDCNNLTDLLIPNNVTSIGECAFCDCKGLKSISIPNSITSIGAHAFYGCSSLASITVEEENPVYRSENNCLIERKTNKLILGCKNSIISKGVTSIGERAFTGCSGLKNIAIPNGVTSIGKYAFSGCKDLTNIIIPRSVISIDGSAFSGLTSIVTFPMATAYTDEEAACSALASIIVENENPVYRSENNCLIEKKTNKLILGCKNSIIPKGVTSIGEYAFSGCSELNSIVFPKSVKSIEAEAFRHCIGLTGITIPKSIISIGIYAFYGCAKLTSIKLSKNVTEIGDGSFTCRNLKEVIMSKKLWETIRLNPIGIGAYFGPDYKNINFKFS